MPVPVERVRKERKESGKNQKINRRKDLHPRGLRHRGSPRPAAAETKNKKPASGAAYAGEQIRKSRKCYPGVHSPMAQNRMRPPSKAAPRVGRTRHVKAARNAGIASWTVALEKRG